MDQDTAIKTQELVRQFVCFKLDELFLGVDISDVQEIIHMVPITQIPKSPSFLEGIINLRGNIIPVVNLSLKFGFHSKKINKSTRIIVVTLSEMTVGFLVHEVSEVIRVKSSKISQRPEIVIENINKRFIDGVTNIEKDDRLLIIVNFDEVFSRTELEKVEQ